MMEKIYCTKNNWYYSDGTKIEFKYHEDKSKPAWKSRDDIIRLMDYEDKEDANELIKKLEMILYD